MKNAKKVISNVNPSFCSLSTMAAIKVTAPTISNNNFAWKNPEETCKEIGRIGNQRLNWNYQDNSVTKISNDIKESVSLLWKFVVTWFQMKTTRYNRC